MAHLRKLCLILCFCIFSLPSLSSDTYLAIGLMSGTSMDGIDGTILKTDGISQIKEIASVSLRYSPTFHFALKTAELLAREQDGEVSRLEKADFVLAMKHYLDTLSCSGKDADTLMANLRGELGCEPTYIAIVNHSTKLHAQLVKALLTKSRLKPSQIKVIGYDGQTLLHIPRRISLQIGSGQLLADLTNIPVVTNFRAQDIAAGGQGAPFAPLYHQALATRDKLFPCAIVNNGGIANISLIYGPNPEDLLGFDTGPGNRLIDLFVKVKTRGVETYDKDGLYGSRGRVNPDLLALLMNKSIIQGGINYFSLKPPKSLDSGDIQLLPEVEKINLEDGCATLELFTAITIAMSPSLVSDRPKPKLWLLGGGGWKNAEVTKRLKEKLPPKSTVRTIDEQGWNNDSLEAQIFAWMAIRSLKKLPLSTPQTTGVPEPTTGGEYYRPDARAIK